LWLQTGFLAALGLLVWGAGWSSERARVALSSRADTLERRLRRIEGDLADARALGRVGEKAARLAHAVKSAVHSLRGLTRFIEVGVTGGAVQREALGGLRLAIDRLEEIVQVTLAPETEEVAGRTSGAELARLIDDVIAEVRENHPGLRWVATNLQALPAVAMPASVVREVLLVIAHNGAEASRREVELGAELETGHLRLQVRDDGPGLDADELHGLFRAGRTTKPGGSGFGLFLARRLLEARGGHLVAGHTGGDGAVFSVSFPVDPSEREHGTGPRPRR
jgi:signal transduction histidine kinase